MKKLLWVGDCHANTGFGRITNQLLPRLAEHWDVSVLAVNYFGDPHDKPYKMYPAVLGGDAHGFGRYQELVHSIEPDLVVFQADPLVCSKFLPLIKDEKTVAYVPLEGANQMKPELAKLGCVVFYCDWALRQAREDGYTGRGEVVNLGVDREIYRPIDKQEARTKMGFSAVIPPDSFIVGNVNRNDPRKRMDLSVLYFADWVKQYSIPPNVYLYLHASPYDNLGYDFISLAKWAGISNRLLIKPELLRHPMVGFSEADMPYVYNSFDVQINTCTGEGWGLSAAEGFACGIPLIAGDYAALGDWACGAANLVPCSTMQVREWNLNTVGRVPDRDEFVVAMHDFYTEPDFRHRTSERSLACSANPKYNWNMIAAQFNEILCSVT